MVQLCNLQALKLEQVLELEQALEQP